MKDLIEKKLAYLIINCSFVEDSGLFHGRMGFVLFFAHLYWNPYYIIGDLTQQSIVEVWNSPKALQLAFPKREDFRDESPCKSCKIFEECYAFPNRCIVDVLKGYGFDNKDFPDPRCVNAPRHISVLIPR